jgi:Mn2+/Fe2+ NRAMP family transporter
MNRKEKRLPKVGSLWLLLGPAFVWAATAQGSGELIWWPYLVARYGGAFLSLLLPAAMIQFFVNKEISRYTALTGQGIWKGFVGLSKWYAWPLFLLCFVNFLWFGGYASAGGSSLFEVLRFPMGVSERMGSLFWAYILVAVFTIGLLFSKTVYKFIERVMKVVTGITIAGLLVSVILVGSKESWIGFLGFLTNFSRLGEGVDWTDFDYSKLITALVFAGMGGFLNLMYSYWMKDKGVGMAKYGKPISGLLAKKGLVEEELKLGLKDEKENKKRWRGWLGYLNVDSGLAVVINAATIVMTSFLAYVLLWPERNYPDGWSITVAQSAFFESSFGVIGRVVFLMVAAAFLVDTWLALADGVSRQFADFTVSVSKRAKKKGMRWWYYFWLVFLIGVTVVTMPLAQPGALMMMVGVISMFAFVFYIPALWYLNYVKLPKENPAFTKPAVTSGLLLGLAWLLYTGLAGWYISILI